MISIALAMGDGGGVGSEFGRGASIFILDYLLLIILVISFFFMKMPSKIQTRSFASLTYYDAYVVLRNFRVFELENDLLNVPEKVRHLRTNSLKEIREIRDAALFCVGMSEVIDCKVYFSPTEEQDYDFVIKYDDGSTINYCPVQLKELVSHELNPTATIEPIVRKLSKYADLSSTAVAIRLNRAMRFDPRQLSIPNDLRLGGLWVYGVLSEDQNEWCIWGDFCSETINKGYGYSYPN